MAGVYTYWLYDLVSGKEIDAFPLKNVTFSTRLNDVGHLTAMLPLRDPGVQELQPKANLQLSRTALYIDRDGTLVWGGIVWTRRYSSKDETVQIAGADFLTYLQHRHLTAKKVYTAQSPQAVAQDLIAWSKLAGGGDIDLRVATVGASPQVVTQTWQPWDFKGLAEALHDLASTAPGFDMAVDVAWVQGVPTKTLTLSYPRRGRTAPSTGLVWEYPAGNIDSYEWAEDGTLMAGTVYEVGAGSCAAMLVATGSTPSLIDAGYPLLEAVQPRKDVSDPTRLAAHATADAAAFAAPVALQEVTIRAGMTPVLGSYTPGDDARFRITDPWFPQPAAGGAGFDGYLRLLQIEVTPQDAEGERVVLATGPVPA